MAVIDADAHVIESERTWDYLEKGERRFRPLTIRIADGVGASGESDHWVIDGRVIRRGPADIDGVKRALREMDDIEGRLHHMDELGTDIQVLFPTLFLRPVTTRPEVEVALYRSYNRWLADIWKRGGGRLRWAVAAPTRNMDAAIEELRYGKEHGACAVFARGIEDDRIPSDPSFFPLYEAAEALDLPICIHAATGSFAIHDAFAIDTGMWRFKLPGIHAFQAFLTGGIPDRFPSLRFGFVELSAQWVPYAVHHFVRQQEKRAGKLLDRHDLVRSSRFFVACQTDDDIPYVLTYTGEGNMVMGTDYGHADTSSELEALQRLHEVPGVSQAAARRILDDNPRALFGLGSPE